VSAGLDAIEVWHSDHSAGQQRHYSELADRLDVREDGGSDYHGDGVHRCARLGGVMLPATELASSRGLRRGHGMTRRRRARDARRQQELQRAASLRIAELTVAAGERVTVAASRPARVSCSSTW
jgi:hypothetical protein